MLNAPHNSNLASQGSKEYSVFKSKFLRNQKTFARLRTLYVCVYNCVKLLCVPYIEWTLLM